MSYGSGLSARLYNPDSHNLMYMTDQNYDPNYFLDSPTDELVHPSSSDDHFLLEGISEEYHLEVEPDSSHYLLESYQSNFEAGYSVTPSPETVACDDDVMKLKLQELEHALLDDNEEEEDDSMFLSLDHVMDFDGDWAGPDGSTLVHDSPKVSTSSDFSFTSSKKEATSLDPAVSSVRTPRQILLDCATSISEGNLEQATVMINELRQTVSIQGDPSQRIAAYMVEGLAARLASSGKFLYKALKCKEPPAMDRLAAMQILFEVCPCFKFGFMAANHAILEATRGERRVHIIDFDINQGNQYITLLQSLAKQRGRQTRLRLTGVDDPESVQRTVGGLKIIGQRLEKLAEELRVPFKFHCVPSKVSALTPEMLECRAGEALVVNFAFQLHHMPDESVSTINERDCLLRMVKGLNPKLVTVVEQDVNTNTTPFLPRFVEAYSYYSAVFDSLDVTLPRESPDRVNVERQCLARDIVNIVACEGEERIERYEVSGKWRARMIMAGFSCYPMSEDVANEITDLTRQYCDRYKVKEEMGTLHFGWEEKTLIVTSAWR